MPGKRGTVVPLTDRALEVVRLLADGHGNRAIPATAARARQHHHSTHTAEPGQGERNRQCEHRASTREYDGLAWASCSGCEPANPAQPAADELVVVPSVANHGLAHAPEFFPGINGKAGA